MHGRSSIALLAITLLASITSTTAQKPVQTLDAWLSMNRDSDQKQHRVPVIESRLHCFKAVAAL